MLLFTGGTVQALAEQVGVSVMSGIFLDQVQEDPTQCHGVALPMADGDLIQRLMCLRDFPTGRDGVVKD